MVRKGLKLAFPTLQELAREVGVSRASMAAYVLGTRLPSSQVMRRLVAALRKRGTALGTLADELERLTKGGTT